MNIKWCAIQIKIKKHIKSHFKANLLSHITLCDILCKKRNGIEGSIHQTEYSIMTLADDHRNFLYVIHNIKISVKKIEESEKYICIS